MNKSLRITIFLLVFILSTVFFWNAINGYLLKSRAQLASDLQIIPHAKEISCNPKGECYLHIIGSMDEKNGLAGVSGAVRYGDHLKPLRSMQRGFCYANTFGLDMQLQFKDDSANHVLTFAIGTTKKDSLLKGGNGCITTLVFKPMDVQEDPTKTTLQLLADKPWKAGGMLAGQRGAFNPQVDGGEITVTIDSSAPLPTPEPSPTPTGEPGECSLENADCNCDDTVDLVDYEIIRSGIAKEGGSCDVNTDGKTDASDLRIWTRKTDLLHKTN